MGDIGYQSGDIGSQSGDVELPLETLLVDNSVFLLVSENTDLVTISFPETSIIEYFTGTNGISPPNSNWLNV
jgi:hypothetical protein